MNVRRALALIFVVATANFLACFEEEPVVQNPGFDVWNGNELTAWTVEQGSVSKVPTWHRLDYGIQLDGNPTVLSQFVDIRSPENTGYVDPSSARCLTISYQTDGTPDAPISLSLDIDFLDDGTVEYTTALALTDWQLSSLSVVLPDWYAGLRFRLHKTGDGPLVLAYFGATRNNGDCPGDQIRVYHLPLGAPCEYEAECASSVCYDGACGECSSTDQCSFCEEVPCAGNQVCGREYQYDFQRAYAGCGPYGRHGAGAQCYGDAECAKGMCYQGMCVACRSADDCATDEVCGIDNVREYADCVPRFADTLGQPCLTDAECAQNHCTNGLCSACSNNADCASDEMCTPQNVPGGTNYLTCILRASRPLGDDCALNDECGSGVCCEVFFLYAMGKVCSECCPNSQGCADGSACTQNRQAMGSATAKIYVPYQCGPQDGSAAPGEVCLLSEDCQSGVCSAGSTYGRCDAGCRLVCFSDAACPEGACAQIGWWNGTCE